jgi:ectoine hydroxylase-related dioxygenase (phytanoyl-CoA dioxygenase family)
MDTQTRLYFNPDGSPKRELKASDRATPDVSAARRGVDPAEVSSLLAEVEERGYVVLREILPLDAMAAVKDAASPFLTHDGRNEIEGFRTRRIYSVIEKTLACNPLVEHPLVLALLDQLLLPNYLLSQLQVIDIQPGEVAQPLHHDDGFYPFPRPRRAISAATIWAIDDFTEENGATLVLPKSHLWGSRFPNADDQPDLVPAVMPSGSAIFFLGTLWHGAGANRSRASRMAATAQYCEPWARQQENYSLAVSRERARLCSPAIQGMLGYSMLFPFIGFVNGRDPRRLLEP